MSSNQITIAIIHYYNIRAHEKHIACIKGESAFTWWENDWHEDYFTTPKKMMKRIVFAIVSMVKKWLQKYDFSVPEYQILHGFLVFACFRTNNPVESAVCLSLIKTKSKTLQKVLFLSK